MNGGAGRRAALTLLCLTALLAGAQALAQMPFGGTVPVQGQVISRSRGPVPGVTVSLIHPALGRSAPAFTDGYGRFGWNAIPLRPEPYFLEIYWGQQLMYRQPVRINQPLMLPPIYL